MTGQCRRNAARPGTARPFRSCQYL